MIKKNAMVIFLCKLKKIMGSAGGEIDVPPVVSKLVNLFFMTTFVAHLFGCFWFFMADQALCTVRRLERAATRLETALACLVRSCVGRASIAG